MCGLAALIHPAHAAPPQARSIAAMVAAIRHRGPDGEGVAVNETVGLGHVRLAILDLAGGAQPMGNEDGMVQVVFNGEIFNFAALRASLEARGHCFATRSDTEVLVHLYEEQGDAMLDALDGQFAFVLHDRRRRRVLMARDRVGIRPLFWARVGQGIAVASEAKALFTLPGLRRALDPIALAETLSFWTPLGARSAFEGIQQLPPGHRMVLDLNDPDLTPQISQWWDWCFPEGNAHDGGSEAEHIETLRRLLDDSVRAQQVSDVPVGTYLSGGLDSSIVSSLIRDVSGEGLQSFSLVFDEASYDERSWQQLMVRQLGTQHHEVRMDAATIAGLFPQAIYHAEMPLLRTAPAPMLALARAVRAAGVRVVLTGEGADEAFAGYDIFKEAAMRRFLARQPKSRCRPRLLERLYPWMPKQGGRSALNAHWLLDDAQEELSQPWASHALRLRSTRRALAFLTPDRRAELGAIRPEDTLSQGLPEAFSRWTPLARAQYIEAHTLMSGYLLSAQGDRMAMGGSIEARFPFLDHRLIEFANRLPPRRKLRGLDEKWLLKKAFAARLPDGIVRRPKQPYRAPESQVFFVNGQLRESAAELLSPSALTEAGWFDPSTVQRLIGKLARGQAASFSDNSAFLAVLSVQGLHAQFVAPAGALQAPL